MDSLTKPPGPLSASTVWGIKTLTTMSKLCFRLGENQKMKVRRPPKNHQKSMKKRLRKHVGKKSPILVQNGSTWGPTWAPRGDLIWGSAPLGAFFVFEFLLFLGVLLGPLGGVLAPTWGHFGTVLGPCWDDFFFQRPGGLREAIK